MPAPLRLLVVTGDADKAQALVSGLRSPEVEPVWQWVTNEQELRRGLEAGTDVVLADEEYLPFGTLDVLKTIQAHSPHVPLIMVALGPSAERIAEGMGQGLADVVRKDRLNGLGQAISKARDEYQRRSILVDLNTNELQRLSRAYQTLSACNQAMLRAADDASLLQSICGILTTVGGYRLAWVGAAEHDTARTVRPLAWAGHDDGYLDAIRVTWADDALGQGPVGRAIRTREPQIVHFVKRDPAFAPWREEALKRGYLSVMALPLVVADEVFGALAIYAGYAEAFDPREVELLKELAGDLAYGLEMLRIRRERAEIEAALRESEEMYRLLTETARDLILVHDLQGRVRYVNQAGLEFAGYTMSEVRGRNIAEFLAPEYHALVERNLRERLAGNMERFLYEVELLNKAGERVAMDVSSSPILYEGEPVAVLVLARDISARRRAEEALRRQHDLAEAIASAAAVLNSTLDLESVLQGILISVGQVVPHDSANIMLLDERKEYIYFAAHHGYRERGLADWLERQRWPVAQIANLHVMMETLQPLIIPDVRAYAGWVDIPETRRVRSFASAPIQVGGEVIGFLNLDSETVNFFKPEEHAGPLQVFANHAAIALRNARLYASEKERSAELERRVAERTQELQQSQAFYQAIVEDQSELICRYTAHGTLIFANRAYAEFFGQSPQALFGQRFLATLGADAWDALAEGLAALSPEQPVLESEQRLVDANGAERWIHWINRLVSDAEGRPVGFQAVGRDITARRQFEESLQKALDHAIELNDLKSRFVSMVSHEFRNPLAVMQTSVQMLQRYADRLSEADKRRHLDNLQVYIHRMNELLEEVLTVSQAEAGKLTFKPEPVDVAALCRTIVDEIRTIVPPSLNFSVTCEGDCRAVVDPRLMTLAVSNLVSNAAKYSRPEGIVRVGVRSGERTLTVSVQDEGIGIPQREQARVFEGFFRASNVGSLPGTGLGLMIARHCVMRHGGTLSFQSQENVGTTFTLTVPLEPSNNGNGQANNSR
ncbi:MAG: PAS domain S-box protein [Aggregatilineaceae bacterium]